MIAAGMAYFALTWDAGNRPLMLTVLDLDDFKGVNDRTGHGAGDALLCETVERLTAVLRPLDVVGRLGGDEFAVLFPGADQADAESLVSRLRDALEGRVAASFGYSCFPADGLYPEELFKQADLRLYAAKAQQPRQRGDRGRELIWATALADAVVAMTSDRP